MATGLKTERLFDDVGGMAIESAGARLRNGGAAGRGEAEFELRALLEGFEGEARGSRRLIRQIADADWPAFHAAAIEVLKTLANSRGGRYLISLLIGRDGSEPEAGSRIGASGVPGGCLPGRHSGQSHRR